MESFAFENASVYARFNAVGKLNSPSGWGAAFGADRLMHPLLNLLYGVGTTPVNSKESLGEQWPSWCIGPWVVQGRLVTRIWPCRGAPPPIAPFALLSSMTLFQSGLLAGGPLLLCPHKCYYFVSNLCMAHLSSFSAGRVPGEIFHRQH